MHGGPITSAWKDSNTRPGLAYLEPHHDCFPVKSLIALSIALSQLILACNKHDHHVTGVGPPCTSSLGEVPGAGQGQDNVAFLRKSSGQLEVLR